ncbi:MAG: hypothetical protein JJT95_11695 [Pararhodobacter sp.]|nr:hypothetical protein [Pararhodobacter sp.]
MPFPSDRLAAHLAHLLNPPATADPDTLRPGFLYAELTRTLGKPQMAGKLLHQPAYAWRMGPEEAADAYFRATFERALRLSGRTDRSVAHLVLIALVRRGQEDFWSAADLRRQGDHGEDNGGAAAPFWPAELRALAKALERLPANPEPGSAALKIREREGVLWLCCQPAPHVDATPARLAVADEISIWTAIDVAVWDPLGKRPRVLRELAPGPEFNAFCAVLIDALRTANRPVQELLGLGRGLCPFDWVSEIPVNRLRALRKFLGALPANEGDCLPAWETAFARHPVPGHASARALWDSPIGQALRRVEAPQSAPAAMPDDEPEAEFVADSDQFDSILRVIGESGTISAAELRLVGLLHRGIPMIEALERTGLIGTIADLDDALAEYIDDLQARIEAARLELPA